MNLILLACSGQLLLMMHWFRCQAVFVICSVCTDIPAIAHYPKKYAKSSCRKDAWFLRRCGLTHPSVPSSAHMSGIKFLRSSGKRVNVWLVNQINLDIMDNSPKSQARSFGDLKMRRFNGENLVTVSWFNPLWSMRRFWPRKSTKAEKTNHLVDK